MKLKMSISNVENGRTKPNRKRIMRHFTMTKQKNGKKNGQNIRKTIFLPENWKGNSQGKKNRQQKKKIKIEIENERKNWNLCMFTVNVCVRVWVFNYFACISVKDSQMKCIHQCFQNWMNLNLFDCTIIIK